MLSRLASVRVRAVLSLGVLLGFGATGTLASWSDTAVVETGTITSGTMDLRLDGTGATGLGTGYAKTSITWSGLAPDERKAFPLTVNNVGNPNFTVTGTVAKGSTPTWTFSDSAVTVQVFSGTVTPDTTYPQQDTCSGAALGSRQTIGTGTPALFTSPLAVAAGGSQQLCVVVGLSPDATNPDQGKTGSLALTLTATQATS